MVQPTIRTTTTTRSAHKEPAAVSTLKRRRPEVQVVTCAAAFPISSKPKRAKEEAKWPRSNDAKSTESRNSSDNTLLDWHDTVKQVRHLGLTGMVGVQKRNHLDEQYKRLTGREKKKHQVPLPIVRGIKRKAAAREARLRHEAKEAGIVLPTAAKTATLVGSSNNDRNKDSTNRVHGPAPSIGFMKKGIFRLPSNPKR
jgi:Domain of unknown function (DUF4602)